MVPIRMHVEQLVEHLFRRQFAKMVSTLTRILGVHNLQLAEDVVQEALVKATEQWPRMGVPDKPEGWLWQVARNKAMTSCGASSESRRNSTHGCLRWNQPPFRICSKVIHPSKTTSSG